MSYSSFARYYDALTRNADYKKRADYFCSVLERLGHNAGLTLDLACGTASFTLELAARGFDVFGLDSSAEMLSAAQQKSAETGYNILFICQQMQKLDLYGTVDTVVCTLDGINHLTNEKDVMETFRRVSLFLNPGGYFIFDANTVFKHKHILGNNVFVYDTEDVYCVWQNNFEGKSNRVAITLDFFERNGNFYTRSSEHFYERAYEALTLTDMLSRAGMQTVGVWENLSFKEPAADSEKILIAAQKPK